jgi:hypothetical protein
MVGLVSQGGRNSVRWVKFCSGPARDPIEHWSGERFLARPRSEGGVEPASKSEPQLGPLGGKPSKRLQPVAPHFVGRQFSAAQTSELFPNTTVFVGCVRDRGPYESR